MERLDAWFGLEARASVRWSRRAKGIVQLWPEPWEMSCVSTLTMMKLLPAPRLKPAGRGKLRSEGHAELKSARWVTFDYDFPHPIAIIVTGIHPTS